ncbi:MAG TPA: glycosyl hydrolase 53 family protein [Bacteroidales bacterium]|nr:glycosyl hydrolase 53 family protein [Bacteroidales bacterium]HNS46397.1 glycosyl hydrolase 53 family protein [Bacteroidales bacterium]
MKLLAIITLISILFLAGCKPPSDAEFGSVSRVASGKPVSVMLTSYSTTLLADGRDETRLRIAVTDSLEREITTATDSIRIYVTGKGKIIHNDGSELSYRMDTTGQEYALCQLKDGICNLLFRTGTEPDRVKVEARAEGMWPGSHEIHTIPADVVMMKPTSEQCPPTAKPIDRMIGADISFLPQLEDRGTTFTENGVQKDALLLLQGHGFNYIRLRIFVDPAHEKGYAPGKGYCGLDYTLAMARRIEDAGMKLLLNFHYSDYWADPQQQYKPHTWEKLDFESLKDSVKTYTSNVIRALQQQGTLPAVVQVGNEINHGMLWPEGYISRPDQLAELLKAGVEGVNAVDRGIPVMMHIALGGQNEEAVFWLDNMIARGVEFDIIGLSYYPRWHGTLEDLRNNLLDLARRYHKPLNVVEYSVFKKEVHDIVFSLPDALGKGACIWEPLNWRSGLFNQNEEVTDLFAVYDEINRKYLNDE